MSHSKEQGVPSERARSSATSPSPRPLGTVFDAPTPVFLAGSLLGVSCAVVLILLLAGTIGS